MILSNQRALITGAGGFIGANIVRALLRAGAEVHAAVRPEGRLWRLSGVRSQITLYRLDINDGAAVQQTIRDVRPDICIHLAMPGGHPPDLQTRAEQLRTSVIGTWNLIDALISVSCRRFVHVSSSLVYGPHAEPLQETMYPQPSTFRGMTKAAADAVCEYVARAGSLPCVIIRPFSVYGYWEGPTRLIPTAVLAALRHSPMRLTTPGYQRDFIFVDDVVDLCLLALQHPEAPGEIFNAGSGQQWSNEEVVALIQGVSGESITIEPEEFPARPPDTAHWMADISKARRVLGWTPTHTLRSGLEKTVAWYREHLDLYERADGE